MSASAAFASVPPVEIISSTTTAILPFTSPTIVVTSDDVGLRPALEDDRYVGAQALREVLRARHAAGVGRHHDDLFAFEALRLEIRAERRRGDEIVDGKIEEPLNLRRVQIERDEAFGARLLDQIRDELGRDRFAAFGFLILLRVAVVRDDGGDAVGRRAAERVDHQEQFHERIVDRVAARGAADRLNDEDFRAAHVLLDLDAALFVLELIDEGAAEARIHSLRDLAREIDVGVPAKE